MATPSRSSGDVPNAVVALLAAGTLAVLAFTVWIFTSDTSSDPGLKEQTIISTEPAPTSAASPTPDRTGCLVALNELGRIGSAFAKYGDSEMTGQDMAGALKRATDKLDQQASLASGPVLLSLQRTASGYAKMRVNLIEKGNFGPDTLVDSTVTASTALKDACQK
jgi:hypothetical protein